MATVKVISNTTQVEGFRAHPLEPKMKEKERNQTKGTAVSNVRYTSEMQARWAGIIPHLGWQSMNANIGAPSVERLPKMALIYSRSCEARAPRTYTTEKLHIWPNELLPAHIHRHINLILHKSHAAITQVPCSFKLSLGWLSHPYAQNPINLPTVC